MGIITLPESMERDRQNNIKANSVHVDNNFDALLNAVNNKIDKDGTMTVTSNIPMSGHKITGLGTPTQSADAATLGWVNDNACMLSGSQTIADDKGFSGNVSFSGNVTAVTRATSDNSTKVATTAFVVNILKAIYPVGSVYIGTQNSCPMAQFFGTWTLVSSGRALWTGNGSNGNSTIAAGLPNITGKFGFIGPDVTSTSYFNHASGAFTGTYGTQGMNGIDGGGVYTGGWGPNNMEFKASNSSSVYGNSSTVQPPAYVVNVWRRTA